MVVLPNYEVLIINEVPTGTGEHGVGIGKKEYLVDELGPDTVALMRSVKKTIDPLNIMNPSKVIFRNHTQGYVTDVAHESFTQVTRLSRRAIEIASCKLYIYIHIAYDFILP